MALPGVRDHRNAVLGGRRARAMMRAIRRRPDSQLSAHLSSPRTDTPRTAVVDWAFYRDGRRQDDLGSYTEAVERARAGVGFVWIGLFEPTGDQLAGIAEEFDLHALAVEDAVTAHQRPKLERYGDSLFVGRSRRCATAGTRTFTAASEVVETGELMVFVGPEFVVTVRHGRHSELGRVRRQLEDDPDQLRHGPSAVLHAVADRVVDDYLAVVDRLQRRHRGDRDLGLLRPRRPQRRTRSTSSSARCSRSSARSPRWRGPLRQLAERPRAAGGTGDPGVLPRRRGPPRPGARAGAGVRRAPHLDPAGGPGPAHRRRERGHAQDLRLGGDRWRCRR